MPEAGCLSLPQLVSALTFAALLTAAAPSRASCDLVSAGVVLVPSPGWTPALIDDLCAGLAALPAIPIPGGPLELELHPELAELGLGDGVSHREWSDGLRRFHLYAYARSTDVPTNHRLDELTPEQVEHLWRRRAMVHAVIRRLDAAHGWSQRGEWQRIAGWSRLPLWGEVSVLDAPWGFSRLRGGASAALDLATFAEERLVPPESVGRGPPVDDAVQCQEFLRGRVLISALDEVAPGSAKRWARGVCPAFDAWSNPGTLDHLEVLFAEPSARHPEALFGHLILRPVRANGQRDMILEAGAAVTAEESMPLFVFRGLTGGYPAIFTASDLERVLREDNQSDQRTLRRFRLHVTPEESARIQERMWELERRGYTPYRFLDRNCGSLLLFTLSAALDGDHQPSLLSEPEVMPMVVLDALADVEEGEGSLLTLEPNPLKSDVAIALDAERDRSSAVGALAELMPEHADEWHTWLGHLESRDHAAAEGEIGERVEAGLAAAAAEQLAEADRLLVRVVRDTLALERYAADRALKEAQEIDHDAILHTQSELTVDALVKSRHEAYSRERPDLRMHDDMERFIHRADEMVHLPRRPLRPDEQRRFDRDLAERSAYVKLAAACGEALDRLELAVPTEAATGASTDAAPGAETTQVTSDPAALRTEHLGSGYLRSSIGAAVGSDGSAGLWLRSAFLDERIGEQRDRGIGPWSELRLLGSDFAATVHDGHPVVERTDLQPVRLRTLITDPPPLRTAWWSGLGRGFGLEALYDHAQLVGRSALAHAEVYQVLAASPDATSIVAVGAGPEGELRYRNPGGALALGPRLELFGRLPFSDGISGIRLESDALPAWAPWSPQHVELDLHASLGAEIAIGPDRAGLYVIPSVQVAEAWVGDKTGGMLRAVLEVEAR